MQNQKQIQIKIWWWDEQAWLHGYNSAGGFSKSCTCCWHECHCQDQSITQTSKRFWPWPTISLATSAPSPLSDSAYHVCSSFITSSMSSPGPTGFNIFTAYTISNISTRPSDRFTQTCGMVSKNSLTLNTFLFAHSVRTESLASLTKYFHFSPWSIHVTYCPFADLQIGGRIRPVGVHHL